MNDRLDHILKETLAPDQTPDLRLNQKILNQVKERNRMKKKAEMGSRNRIFSCICVGRRNRSGICGVQTADSGTDGRKNRG